MILQGIWMAWQHLPCNTLHNTLYQQLKYSQVEAKTPNQKWYLLLKFRTFTVSYIHNSSLTSFLYTFDEYIFKFCKHEFGITCCFNILIGIWHIRSFFFFSLFCVAVSYIWKTKFRIRTCLGAEVTFVAESLLQRYPWC